ncbi:ROK family protein, partial [Roseburia inulinivorans]
VENDVNAAALGELRSGAGTGCDDFLCLTYGTGVGGSIVMNGNVYPGASFSAGSFGGMVIHPEEKAGTDSLEGCYERCASTTGLVRRVKKVDGSLDNGKKIFAAKDRPEIKEQIDAWIDDICTGLVTLCCIFNPFRIILGGGIMAQEYVLSEVNRKV